MHHVLLAIDDPTLRASASDYLSGQGYLTSADASSEAANRVGRRESADILIVDAAGCADEAIRVCSAVRRVSAVPMIVLTARDDSEERIRGLDAGVDDYLVKPFNPRELVARIKVVCRRASFLHGRKPQPRGYSFGEWRLDVESHTLRHSDGTAQVLTASEFRLLEALATHPQEVLPRAQLLRLLHGNDWRCYERSIETRMSRMRQLLRQRRNAAGATLIRSVYGAGYLFATAVETDYLLLPPGRDASCEVR